MTDDQLERRMKALAARWQDRLNRMVRGADGDETRRLVDAMLTVAVGNLVQLSGPCATAQSLELIAGMMRHGAEKQAVARAAGQDRTTATRH